MTINDDKNVADSDDTHIFNTWFVLMKKYIPFLP